MGFPIGMRLREVVRWTLDDAEADLSAATGTLTLLSLPADSVVHKVQALVLTAVTGATSEIVGDGSDTNGYLEDGFAAATGVFPLYAHDAASTYVGAYQFDSTDGGTDALDVSIKRADKYYSSADTIDYIIAGTATAGSIKFLIDFTRLN